LIGVDFLHYLKPVPVFIFKEITSLNDTTPTKASISNNHGRLHYLCLKGRDARTLREYTHTHTQSTTCPCSGNASHAFTVTSLTVSLQHQDTESIFLPLFFCFPVPSPYCCLSHSSFECPFLLHISSASTSPHSFHSLLILLLPLHVLTHVNPFLFQRSFSCLYFLALLFSAFLFFTSPLFRSSYILIYFCFLPVSSSSSFFLFFSFSFFFTYILFLLHVSSSSSSSSASSSSSIILYHCFSLTLSFFIYYRHLRKTEESFGSEPEQTLISNKPPHPLSLFPLAAVHN